MNLAWVEDYRDVEGAYVLPGQQAMFMYRSADEFAVKTVGLDGRATIAEYRFERKPPRPIEGYVPVEEHDALKRRLEDVESALARLGGTVDRGPDGGCSEVPGEPAAGEGGS